MIVLKRLLSLTLAPVLICGLCLADAALPQVFVWKKIAGTNNKAGTTDGADPLFRMPSAGVFDSHGNLYVADTYNHTIRKITATDPPTTPATYTTTSVFAGKAKVSGRQDGTAADARFNLPSGLAIDLDDVLYVADRGNHTIRKITAAGVVTTIAGVPGLAGGQNSGTTSGTTTAAKATFNGPSGVAVDSTGKIYVADQFNHTIRVISTTGSVTTLAGSTRAMGFMDGSGTAALFNQPTSIALLSDTELFVTDSQNQVIRRVTSGGIVTTYAGKPRTAGSANGTLMAARFRIPTGIVADYKGNFYIAEQGNQTIRKIKPNGQVITIGGTVGKRGAKDGVGLATEFNFPRSIAIDSKRTIYVFDRVNQRIVSGTPTEGVLKVTDTATPATEITKLEFTTTTILTPKPLTFKIANTAAVDLTNIFTLLTGTDSSDFTVSAVPLTLTAVTVPDNTTAVITVTFTPKLKNPTAVPLDVKPLIRSATLKIYSDDVTKKDPFEITLTGNVAP